MSWMQCILQLLFIYLINPTVTPYIPYKSLRVTIWVNPWPAKRIMSPATTCQRPLVFVLDLFYPAQLTSRPTGGDWIRCWKPFPWDLLSFPWLVFSQWMALTGVGALLKLLPCLIEGRQWCSQRKHFLSLSLLELDNHRQTALHLVFTKGFRPYEEWA